MTFAHALLRAGDELLAPLLAAFGEEGGRLVVITCHTMHASRSKLEASGCHPQQRTTLDDLQRAVEFFAARGYKFVGEHDLNGFHGDLPQNCCMITFDDGYFNNIKAFEYLAAQGVPAVVFAVASNVIDTQAFWWDAVFRRGVRQGKNLAEINRVIEQTKRVHPRSIRPHLNALGITAGDLVPTADANRPMRPDELGDVAASGRVAVGNHMYDHEIVPRLGATEAETSLRASQRALGDICGRPPTLFAFPNGDGASEEFGRSCETAGLRFAFTLDARNLSGAKDLLRRRWDLGRFLLWGQADVDAQCRKMMRRASLENLARRGKRRVQAWLG